MKFFTNTMDNTINGPLHFYMKELIIKNIFTPYGVMPIVFKLMAEVALDLAQNNQSNAAKLLGVSRNTLRKYMTNQIKTVHEEVDLYD